MGNYLFNVYFILNFYIFDLDKDVKILSGNGTVYEEEVRIF